MIERFVNENMRLSFADRSRLRLLAVALAVGFGLLAGWRFGWNLAALTTALYAWILLIFAIIDSEQRIVPDRLLLLALPVILVINLLAHQPTLFSALLGGLVGLALFSLVHYIRPDGMGWGDVKLAGLIGLMVGFPGVVFALLLGMIAGGVAALFYVYRGQNRQQTMAYAPFLVTGAAIILFLR